MDWLQKILENAVYGEDGKLNVAETMKKINEEASKHIIPKEQYNGKVKELDTANETIKQLKKDGTISALNEIDTAADNAAKARTLMINVTTAVAQKIGGAGANAIVNAANGFRKFNGIDNVPYDGYQAVLHKNERVLTAEENKAYTANQDKTDYNAIRSIVRSELRGITIELNDREMGRAYSRYAKERRSI